LYSDCGRSVRERYGLSGQGLQTLVLIEGGRAYLRSAAAARLARRLVWPWKLLQWTVVMPEVLRDAGYDWIAANRYRFFGRGDECMVANERWKGKFLDGAGRVWDR